MPKSLSHLDDAGRLRMVDVGGKAVTRRKAIAEGFLIAGSEIIAAVPDDRTPKGNALEAARLAGIMAAKQTAQLIPLCHSLPLDHVQIDFDLLEDRIRITASATTRASTGVEMEALTAVSVAALTLYDMLKALSHEMTITDIRLLEKSGGKSGKWVAGMEKCSG
jgi:cyclic pyranopterin monophosphate synthase